MTRLTELFDNKVEMIIIEVLANRRGQEDVALAIAITSALNKHELLKVPMSWDEVESARLVFNEAWGAEHRKRALGKLKGDRSRAGTLALLDHIGIQTEEVDGY